jgi:DNA-binding NarL/FixJ family response regulator
MQKKAEIARQLLVRGLTIRQIAAQLNCSETFVQRIRDGEAS